MEPINRDLVRLMNRRNEDVFLDLDAMITSPLQPLVCDRPLRFDSQLEVLARDATADTRPYEFENLEQQMELRYDLPRC